MKDFIEIKGARVHNLKNIDIRIPRNKLTVITGVSGSGKSSLAFDTIYEEGKRRYLTFSGTNFMVDTSPGFESMTGLSPTVAVEQRIIRQSNPRSTVGTRTKIGNMLAVLFATYGKRNPDNDDGLPLSMEMFQKNSPKGMCIKCLGSGVIHSIAEDKIFSDGTKQIKDLLVERLLYRGGLKRRLDEFCSYHGITPQHTLDSLTESQLLMLKYGDGGKTKFSGIISFLYNCFKWGEVSGRQNEILLREYGSKEACPRCSGTGLGEQAIHTTILGKTITELENMYIKDLLFFLIGIRGKISGTNLIDEIIVKLRCMVDVGLHHLALSRPVPTLSGGEIQRLFLASFIIAEMDSIIFIFDEPTIGLHEVEKEKLIGIIKNLVKRGNTVIAVEHDKNFMRVADYIIDLGPDAGIYGGERLFQGSYSDFMACISSKTAPYLSGNCKLPVKNNFKTIDNSKLLKITGANTHNLQNVSLEIPLGMIVGIAGVSGSGKSSLIADTLVPKLREMLKNKFVSEDEIEIESSSSVQVKGTEHIAKCIVVDQKPIGRSKTSCPATYIGILDRIRTLYANTPESIEKGYGAGLFTVNSEGGCSSCKGEGVIHHHVGFGNFIDLECDTCAGTGFVEEAMEITLNGKNIRQVLEMTVSEAIDFFGQKDKSSYDKNIHNMLETLERVGMGYIKLGQKTPTISGGEAQRIKLGKELCRQKGKANVYILDEPTTGLSFADTEKLLRLLQELSDSGNTVIITEHDPAVLANCDYIVEMGPGGGTEGGYVIATGTPLELTQNKESVIGKYLKAGGI